MTTDASATPLQCFQAGLAAKGYVLDLSSHECRKIGSTIESNFYIVPITGHGMADIFLFEEGKGSRKGVFTFGRWRRLPSTWMIALRRSPSGFARWEPFKRNFNGLRSR